VRALRQPRGEGHGGAVSRTARRPAQ
jgi:hypothetical protein